MFFVQLIRHSRHKEDHH
jgi:hypothetical protein